MGPFRRKPPGGVVGFQIRRRVRCLPGTRYVFHRCHIVSLMRSAGRATAHAGRSDLDTMVRGCVALAGVGIILPPSSRSTSACLSSRSFVLSCFPSFLLLLHFRSLFRDICEYDLIHESHTLRWREWVRATVSASLSLHLHDLHDLPGVPIPIPPSHFPLPLHLRVLLCSCTSVPTSRVPCKTPLLAVLFGHLRAEAAPSFTP